MVRVSHNLKMSTLDKEVLRLTKRFSTNLKKMRIKKGLTQEDMVEYGFNYRHYQRLESGTNPPSFSTLVRLAQIMGVEVTEFFLK